MVRFSYMSQRAWLELGRVLGFGLVLALSFALAHFLGPWFGARLWGQADLCVLILRASFTLVLAILFQVFVVKESLWNSPLHPPRGTYRMELFGVLLGAALGLFLVGIGPYLGFPIRHGFFPDSREDWVHILLVLTSAGMIAFWQETLLRGILYVQLELSFSTKVLAALSAVVATGLTTLGQWGIVSGVGMALAGLEAVLFTYTFRWSGNLHFNIAIRTAQLAVLGFFGWPL